MVSQTYTPSVKKQAHIPDAEVLERLDSKYEFHSICGILVLMMWGHHHVLAEFAQFSLRSESSLCIYTRL